MIEAIHVRWFITKAWRVLRLRMEVRPPGTEGSCEYTEKQVVGSRQGVALQLGGWEWGRQSLALNFFIVTKYYKRPLIWYDSSAQPKQWKKA
jgi:hypothetical protein